MRFTARRVVRSGPIPALRRCALLGMAAGTCASAQARAIINAAWASGVSGVWNAAANWSPAGVPNNGANTFNVTIAVAPVGASYTVTNSAATTIDSLAVTQANALLLHTVTLFTVLGNVNLNAGTFRHTGGLVDVNGGMTIGGAGVMGGNGTWDIAGGDLNNNGVIRTDAGGTLTFNSGGVAGVGVWDLDGASGAGEVDASNGSMTFNGTLNDTFDGTITVGAGRTVNISGGWALNNGTLNLNGTATAATMTSTAGAFIMNGGDISVDQQGLLNASSLNFAGGAVTIADANDELTLGGTTVFLNGTTFSGLGTLTFDQNSVTATSTTIGVAVVDWDGSSGALTHTINAGQTLAINATRIDVGGTAGQFDGTINNNGTLAINLTGGAWTLGNGGDLNLGAGAVLNGTAFNVSGLIGVASGSATINAAAHFDATPGIVLDNATDNLNLFGGGSFAGGTVNGPGSLALDGDWSFTGSTVINADLDFDGTNLGSTLTIGPGASLTVSSDQSNDNFGDDLVLNGGALSITSATGWTIDQFGSLTMQNADLDGTSAPSFSVGGAFRMSGALIAQGGGGVSLTEATTFSATSTIQVGVGTLLTLASGGVFEGGAASGAGTLITEGNWNITGHTIWSVATLDWDAGVSGSHTFTVGEFGSLTINGNILDAMDDDVTLNDSTLTVNDPSGWALGAASTLTLNNTGVAGIPTLNGATVGINGVVDVNGIGEIDAAVVFDATPTVLLTAAADRLNLNGGGEFHGGAFGGAGTLSLDGDFDVLADTTFSVATFDWDGGLINADTFRVATGVTATISSNLSADHYDDTIVVDGGALAVTNAAGWTLSADGELRLLNNGGGSALVSGGPLNIAGALSSQNGGVNTITSSAFNLLSTGGVSIPSVSDVLVLDGATLQFAGGTCTGEGTLRVETSAVSVTADTTIGVRVFDWDGLSSFNTTTINAGVQFNILSDLIDEPGDGFGGTINLNNSTLRVVTDGAWEMGDAAGTAGVLNMGGGNPIVGVGSTMNVSGVINVNSLAATILSPVSFLLTAVVDANFATDRLLLNGATTYNGGTYTGLGIMVQNGAATVAGTTTIGMARYDWDGFSNNTTTSVNAGATLTLSGGQIDESDNVFNGVVNDSGTVVVDTTADEWTIGTGGQFNLLTGASRLEGDRVNLVGTLTGQGTVASAELDNLGTITASGGGTLRISTGVFADLDGSSAGETGVINALAGDVRVTGSFGSLFVFNGALNVGAGRTFEMDAFGLLNDNPVGNVGVMSLTGGRYRAPELVQRGTMTVGAGDSTLESSTAFDGAGATTIGASGNLHIVGSALVNPGHTFSGAGRITVDAGSTLRGNGTANVLVSNNGLVTPGTSIGTLTVGSFTQGAGGSLQIELQGDAANQADRLTITGATTLAGNLSIALLPAFQPAWGDQWTVMTYASRTGDFQSYAAPGLAPNLFWWVNAGATAYMLGVRLHADANHDGLVNFIDLNIVLSFFGTACSGSFGRPFNAGDTNEDGLVNFIDLNNVLSFFGTSAPAFAVPAPGAAVLVCVGLGLGAGRRRRSAAA